MGVEFIVALSVFWVVGVLFTWGVLAGRFSEDYWAKSSADVRCVSNIIIGVILIFLWPYFLGRNIAEFVVAALKSRGS